MTTIYNLIYDFIDSLFPSEALTYYQTYINDISFILTIAWVVVLVVIPLLIVWNIGCTICYTIRPKKETRGRKKRD